MRVLDPLDIRLEGHALIEASAGTGKTYTITSLFLRLLLECELDVRDILIVTFTQAATEELKDRVRTRLKKALSSVRGAPCSDAFICHLLKRCTGLHGQDRVRILLEQAIISLDEAAIFTIHGFCQRMLSEYAFETGSTFGAEITPSHDSLLLEATREFWRQNYYNIEPWLGEYITNLFQGPEKMLSILKPLLGPVPLKIEPEATIEACIEEKADIELAINGLKELWMSQKNEMVSLLLNEGCLARRKKLIQKKGIIDAAKRLDDLFGQEAISPISLYNMAQVPFSSLFLSSCLKKGSTLPPSHPFFHKWDEVENMCHKWLTRLKSAILSQALKGIKEVSTQIKDRQGLFSFDDLLLEMDRALSGPEGRGLCALLKRRFKAALIDEFQDTDQVQYSIFEKIYPSPEKDLLILIGDPKQAIYGFRGADIFTYLNARSRIKKERRFDLERNWRSSPGLVEAINFLFSQTHRPFVHEEIPYFKVKSRDPELPCLKDPEPLGDFVIWRPKARIKKDGKKAPLNKGESRRLLSMGCAAEIRRLLEGGRKKEIQIFEAERVCRPLEAGDIAILVRNRNQAGEVKEALSHAGISCVYHARESVFSTDEAWEFLLVLKAVASPGDIGAISTALATEAGGWTSDEIVKLQTQEEKWGEISSTFQELHSLWQKRGILLMFRVLIHKLGIAQRLLQLPGGERRLTNWFQLAELLDEAGDGPSAIEGQISWLAEQIDIQDSDIEEQQLRLESDRDLVTIMTIHRSKGLEFPVVFVPFAWDQGSSKSKSGLIKYYDRKRGCHVVATDMDSHDEDADNQRLSEELRLLYVALTRASVRCYISWGEFKQADQSALGYLLRGCKERELEKCPSITLAPIPTPIEKKAPETDWAPHLYKVRSVAKSAQQVFGVESFSSLSLDVTDHFVAEPGLASEGPYEGPYTTKKNIFSFPKGVYPGNCIHCLLEKIDFSSDNMEPILETSRRCLSECGLDLEWDTVLAQMARDVISTEILPGLKLKAIPSHEIVKEMEFSSFLKRGDSLSKGARLLLEKYESGIIKGFIDLVFSHKGRYYVADYKSNFLGDTIKDYTHDRLEEAMTEHGYHLQAEIYALAIHRLLKQRLPGYSFNKHFGGVLYLFVRGIKPSSKDKTGVYFIAPEDMAKRIGLST